MTRGNPREHKNHWFSVAAYNVAALVGIIAAVVYVMHSAAERKSGDVKPALWIFALLYIFQELLQIPYLRQKTFAVIKLSIITVLYVVAFCILVI